MRIRLTPSNNRFYELLATAASNLPTGAALLNELISVPRESRPDVGERMRAVEHAGDEATHAIIMELNTSFVTPFDRDDIYRLAIRLDDVMDHMDAAVDLAVLYGIETFPDGVKDQIGLLAKAADLTAESLPKLRGLRDLAPYWVEINDLENQADRVYRRLLAYLFDGHLETLTVMKLKEVVDELEAAADAFEHVADMVQTIAVKES